MKKKMKTKQVKDLRVKTKLKRTSEFKAVVNKQLESYAYINPSAEKGGIEFEEEQDDFTRLTQAQLRKSVDVGTSKKLFDFDLRGGPFKMNPSRNGRHVLIGGEAGQLSVIDRTTMNPICDFTVNESVVDVTFLQNYTMFAASLFWTALFYLFFKTKDS